MVQRVLIILVTTLIVARPLILGEDAGLQADLSDPSGTLLTLLWLVAGALWGLSRLFGRGDAGGRGPWGGRAAGAIAEIGLLITVGLVFLSAEVAARYRHPARLIAWEWFALFTAFFVVRRLAADRGVQQGLLTVLLASAVSLSAHAVWQSAVELPRLRAQLLNDPDALRKQVGRLESNTQMDHGYVEGLRRRLDENHVFGTFAHPNSFAGYLALLVPGLVGAAFLLARHASRWKSGLGIASALLGCTALWLSHSRGALLALILVGLAVTAFIWRRGLRAHWPLVLGGMVLLAGAVYGAYAIGLANKALGKDSGTAAQRAFYWRATAKIIAEHPWLGVGPGNFGNAYTKVMDPAAGETIKDPHNFVLEIWATAGVFALVSLLVTLGLFLVPTSRFVLRSHDSGHSDQDEDGQAGDSGVRWEYYLGGMAGLLLGFVIRAVGLQQTELASEAVGAGIRAVFWFGAFGLLEHVPWTSRCRALVLTAGAAALLLNLSVSGGLGFPSVAGPLWIVIALAFGAIPSSADAAGNVAVASATRSGLQVVPLPIFLALTLAYSAYIFDPVSSAMALVEQAGDGRRALYEFAKTTQGKSLSTQIRYFRRDVLTPLEEAVRQDSGNARLHALLADAYGQLWAMEQSQGDLSPQVLDRTMTEVMTQAVAAQRLDPEGLEGYLAEYDVRRGVFAKVLKERAKQRPDRAGEYQELARKQALYAADALADHYERQDPADPYLHYLIARAYFEGGDAVKARPEAQAALRLDAQSGERSLRKLTTQQRRELQQQLGDGSAT